MEITPVSLVLADISGYTRFVHMHTVSLLHAEEIVTQLLEAVLDEVSEPLILNKLEGDAAFLYALTAGDARQAQAVLEQVMRFFPAFRAKQQELIRAGEGGCFCEACCNIGQLKLKTIVHYGRAVLKQVRQSQELAGSDVILAHRLLKNNIPAHEYLLLTTPFHQLSGGLPDRPPVSFRETYPEMGEVRGSVYFVAPPAPDRSGTPRMTRLAGVLSGLKLFPRTLWRRLVGPRTFRNLQS